MITVDEILLTLQVSLLGEIYPSIRAIVYKYEPDTKKFLLRYYLDREPNEDDYYNVSCVVTEFIAYFKFTEFEDLIEECVYSDEPYSKLDVLDGCVYLRKE